MVPAEKKRNLRRWTLFSSQSSEEKEQNDRPHSFNQIPARPKNIPSMDQSHPANSRIGSFLSRGTAYEKEEANMPRKKGMMEMLGLRSKRSKKPVTSYNTAAPGPRREQSAYEATAAVVATAPSLPRSMVVPMGGYVTPSRHSANGYPLSTTDSNSTAPVSPVSDGTGSAPPSIIGISGAINRVDSPVSEFSLSNSTPRPNVRQNTEPSMAAHHAQASRRTPSLRTTVPAVACPILTPVEEEARKNAESSEPVKQILNRPKTWAETSEEFKQQLQQQKEQERKGFSMQAVQEDHKEDDQIHQRLAKEIESTSSSPVSSNTATASPISPGSTLSQSPAVERTNKVREELVKLDSKQAEDERLSELEGFPELPVAIGLPSMTSYAPDRHGQIAELHSHHIPAISSGKGYMHPSLIPGPHNHRRSTSEIQDIPTIALSVERPALPDRTQSEPANLHYGTTQPAATTLGLPTVTIIPPTPIGTPSPSETKEKVLPDIMSIEAEISSVENPVAEKVSEPRETGPRYVIPPPPPPPVIPTSPPRVSSKSLDSHQQSSKHYEPATIQELSNPITPNSITSLPPPEVSTLEGCALDAISNGFCDSATENGDNNGLPSPPLTPEDTAIIPQEVVKTVEISPVDIPEPTPLRSASFTPGDAAVHPMVEGSSNKPEALVQEESASHLPLGLPVLPVKEIQDAEEVTPPASEIILPLNIQKSSGKQPSGFSIEKLDDALSRPATMPPSASAPMGSPPMIRSATMPPQGAPPVPPKPQPYQPYRPPIQRPPSPTTLAGVINSLPPSGAIIASTNNAPADRPQSRQPSPYRSATCPRDIIPIRRPPTPEQDKQPLLACMGDYYPEPRPITPEKDKQPLLACVEDSCSDAHDPSRRQDIRKPSPPTKDGHHAALMNLVAGYQPYPGRPNVNEYAVSGSTTGISRGRYRAPRAMPFMPDVLTTEISQLQQTPTPLGFINDQGKSKDTGAGLPTFYNPHFEQSNTLSTISRLSSAGSPITGVDDETAESPADTERMSIHSLNIAQTATFSGSPRMIQIPHRQELMQQQQQPHHHHHHHHQLHHQFSQPQLGKPFNQHPPRGHTRSQSQDPSSSLQGHNKPRPQEFSHQVPRVWNVVADQEWRAQNSLLGSGGVIYGAGNPAAVRTSPGKGLREFVGQSQGLGLGLAQTQGQGQAQTQGRGQVGIGGKRDRTLQTLEMMNSVEIGLGNSGGYSQAARNDTAQHAILRKPVPGRN
ncbi:hypothetical protein BZA77DRAFT_364326 [Pyronema omphalodes]|nr:hypothetical protein BZA77DRAFT_364326 [Pyronema omphalodes]